MDCLAKSCVFDEFFAFIENGDPKPKAIGQPCGGRSDMARTVNYQVHCCLQWLDVSLHCAAAAHPKISGKVRSEAFGSTRFD